MAQLAKVIFAPRLVQLLTQGLAHSIAHRSARTGLGPGDHQMEAVVQQMMVELIVPHMPSISLISQNELVVRDGRLGRCIPDIVIKKIGGGYWGFFELKTLLQDDQLSMEEVNEDLQKLIAYKAKHPEAAAIFSLVGSRRKLFNSQRRRAWKALKINFSRQAFKNPTPVPQRIDKEFVAIPCGSFDIDRVDIATYMWEIQRIAEARRFLSAEYRFEASMA